MGESLVYPSLTPLSAGFNSPVRDYESGYRILRILCTNSREVSELSRSNVNEKLHGKWALKRYEEPPSVKFLSPSCLNTFQYIKLTFRKHF
jgi:hypothetical protein